jgi:hypothetical protein
MKRLLFLMVLGFFCNPAAAQVPSSTRPWHYMLLEGSTLIDDCPLCGRPTIEYPLRGTFELLFDNLGPIATTYRVTNVQFYAGAKESPAYTVTGSGTYRLGGHLAVEQELSLDTTICNPVPACHDVTLTNSTLASVNFPLIDISITQTQASLTSVFTMHLVAAPVREIWFVVTNGFAPTNGVPPLPAGHVLAKPGARVVRARQWLTASNGLPNPPAGIRLDALDAAPGTGLVFSVSYPNLSALREGDLLSEHGLVQSNQQLTAAFGINPMVPDVGLDAVHVLSGGEIWFSVRTNTFAEGKGIQLRHGDVLSSAGQIVKSNEQLLARFQPLDTGKDHGLDALHVWPNGEIWFSTESSFEDQKFGTISNGDLLSTEGVVIFRNAELLSEFAAPPGNMGLGDIFIVSDVIDGSPPRLLMPYAEGTHFWLRWSGSNRVFRVQRATDIRGPWQPSGEIDPARFFRDPGALTQPGAFYRIEAW